MKGCNQFNMTSLLTTNRPIMTINRGLYFIVGLLFTYVNVNAQNPNWQVNYAEFQSTMTAVVSVSDECVPSADPGDVVAAFDMSGQLRGVEVTTVDTKAFLTIGSNGAGEAIYFKVFDASTNSVYNIHGTMITFLGDSNIGSITDPLLLNFDSDPNSTSGGPDLWVVDATSINLEATGMGTWSQLPGSDGVIADPFDPNSLFTGVIGTTYMLAWTDTNIDGCIPETDEVSVTFAVSEPEDTPERCSDGVDNDGNGLLDCQELSCGKPSISSIAITQPTATSCTSTMSDGVIVISHTGADSFSIDNGMTFQVSSSFSGLAIGEYEVVIKSSFAGCTENQSASLFNTLSAAPPVEAFSLEGPTMICASSTDIGYTIDKPLIGQVSWTYTGQDATVSPDGVSGSVDYGSCPMLVRASLLLWRL